MKKHPVAASLLVSILFVPAAHAAPPVLIAIGTVSPTYEDFATNTAPPGKWNSRQSARRNGLWTCLYGRRFFPRASRSWTQR